jgi:hypothetical protein
MDLLARFANANRFASEYCNFISASSQWIANPVLQTGLDRRAQNHLPKGKKMPAPPRAA